MIPNFSGLSPTTTRMTITNVELVVESASQTALANPIGRELNKKEE